MGPMVCGPGHVPPVGRCVIRLGTRAGHPRVKSPFSGRDFSARRSLSDHGKRGDSHRNRTSAFVFIDNLMPLKGSNHQNRIRTSPAFSYIWADFGFSVSTMSGLVVDLGTSSILAERRPPPNANSRRSATFCLPYTAINRRISAYRGLVAPIRQSSLASLQGASDCLTLALTVSALSIKPSAFPALPAASRCVAISAAICGTFRDFGWYYGMKASTSPIASAMCFSAISTMLCPERPSISCA